MRRKNDSLWKGILEDTFEDMLRFAFLQADAELDLDRGITFLDKELLGLFPEPGKGTATRHVDKLAQVYTLKGEEQMILIHVEVQGYYEEEFPKRMFTYHYRLLERLHKPVAALAIFSGRDGDRMPDRYETSCLGTHQLYRYNTLHLGDYTDEELIDSDNPFALVVLVAKRLLLKGRNLDERLLQEKLDLVRLLLAKGLFTKPKIKSVFRFLNNYIVFKKPEINSIFVKELDRITGKTNTMGILEQIAEQREERGIQKGIEIGESRMAERAIKALLGTLPMKKIAEKLGVSLAYVQKVKKAL